MAARPTRALLENVFSHEECQELVHIQRAFSVLGYMRKFTLVTFRELWGLPEMIPVVRAREKIRQLVEMQFAEELGLFFEFTGVACWNPGSSIQPHADNNRRYLEQRHYSAVLYLNTGGESFLGGNFHFYEPSLNLSTTPPKDCSEPETPPKDWRITATIVPTEGNLLMFSSGSENIHGIDPVTHGKRYTFTLWFTRDPAFNEDVKFLFPVQHQEVDANELEKMQPPNPSHVDNDANDNFDPLGMLLDELSLKTGPVDMTQPVKLSVSNQDEVVTPSFREALEFCSYCKWKLGADEYEKLIMRCRILPLLREEDRLQLPVLSKEALPNHCSSGSAVSGCGTSPPSACSLAYWHQHWLQYKASLKEKLLAVGPEWIEFGQLTI